MRANVCQMCGKVVGELQVHDRLSFTDSWPAISQPMLPTIAQPPVSVWQCPGCKTYYTSDVQKCECERVTR